MINDCFHTNFNHMWRPFASDFVQHSYESFRKRYDKALIAKPIQPRNLNEKFDSKNLFPFNFDHHETHQRLNEFELLQEKVKEQRKKIKEIDKICEYKKKLKIQNERVEQDLEKNKKKNAIQRIRSMASNKSYRNHNVDSQDFKGFNVFSLTTPKKMEFVLKNESVDSISNARVLRVKRMV